MNAVRMLALALLLQNAPPALPGLPAGTASLEGVVVKAGTNDPIPGADLELTLQPSGPLAPSGPLQPNQLAQYATPNPPYTATSGADGKFTFRNIAAGNYKLVAARIGGSWTPVEFGQRGTLGRGVIFPIANGEQRKNVRLEMAPVGSISGRILDVDNRPIGHAAVMAFAPVYRNGERIVTLLELVHSDDHGDYRLFSLTPGRYFVAARLEDLTRRSVPLGFYPPGRMLASDRVESPVVTKRTLPTGEVVEETYQIVYYGGGTNSELASPVDVGAGASVSGVDISLSAGKVLSRHIRGTVTASANAAFPSGTRVVAIPQRYASDMLLPLGLTDSKGVFDLAGAVPGKYYLTALVPSDPNVRSTPPPQPQLGVLSIEVGEGHLDGVSISATPGYLVSGKITLENRTDTDPDLAKIRVELSPEPNVQGFPGLNWNPTFSPNGEFSFRTLQQGDYFGLVTGLPANSYTKSIRMGTRDLMLTPLHVDGPVDGKIEVVVGTDAAMVGGRVLDDRSEPSVNVKVVLVPDAPFRRRWDFYKSTTTDQSGNFTIRLVAPGDYKIFAWEQADDNIWTMSDFLREDEGRGKPIHIGSSASEKIDVSVIPAKRNEDEEEMKHLLPALVALFVQTAFAQTSPGVPLQGVVTERGSDDVVWGAAVELRKEGGNTALYGARTGVDGKFAFPSVAAGRYQLIATGPGYVPAEYGQKRMKGAGLPLVVVAGQAVPSLRIELVPTGAISGRVTDPYGQPIAIADVFVLRSSFQEGQRILTQFLSAKTDERGEFRLFWLTPGTYYLNVVVPDGTNQADLIMNADNINAATSMIGVRTILRDVLSRPIGTGAAENEAHVPVYYPSTTNPQQARPIEVRPGEDIRGIYITAGVVRTFHVRGVVSNFVAGAGMQGQTRLIPTDPAWPPLQTPLDSNTGKFDYGRVVPGSYILYVQVRPPGATSPADALWATMPLEVREQDVDNLTLVPRAGVSLTGKVTVDSQPEGTAFSAGGLFLGMRPDPLVTQQAPSPSTRVSPDGTFVLPGVIAGNYRVYAPPLLSPNNPQLLGGLPPAPPGLENSYVKSIRVGGADVLDSGVRLTPAEGLTMEIVLGSNAGVVEGRVMRDGKPAADMTVGMLPNATSARGYRTDMHRTILTDASGHFQLRGLPPGDYKIFAWEDADKDAIMDLDFVRGYEEKGTRLEIGDGEKKSVELNVIPARVP